MSFDSDCQSSWLTSILIFSLPLPTCRWALEEWDRVGDMLQATSVTPWHQDCPPTQWCRAKWTMVRIHGFYRYYSGPCEHYNSCTSPGLVQLHFNVRPLLSVFNVCLSLTLRHVCLQIQYVLSVTVPLSWLIACKRLCSYLQLIALHFFVAIATFILFNFPIHVYTHH